MLLPIISRLFSNLFLCAFFEILRILYYMLIPFSGPVPRAGIWDSLFYIRILLNTNNRRISVRFPVSCSGFSSFALYIVRFLAFFVLLIFSYIPFCFPSGEALLNSSWTGTDKRADIHGIGTEDGEKSTVVFLMLFILLFCFCYCWCSLISSWK